jgi:rSAM/selenodomain-associated transferase 1
VTALAVIAKAPVAGRSKTRLMPPCTPEQAAALAAAALADTLAALLATPADRYVVVLEGGAGGPWVDSRFDVIAQRGDGLAERLAAAFADIGEPALVVGMDTPQVSPVQLTDAIDRLATADAVLGPAPDGGYWTIGLQQADDEVFEGVPMSVPATCAAQRARLHELGLTTRELSSLRDVDDIDDASAVAALAPQTQFARTFAALSLTGVAAT